MIKTIRRLYNIDVDAMLNLPGKVHVYWKDTKGRYLGSNALMLDQLGLTSIEEIKGKKDCDLAWRKVANIYSKNDKLVIQQAQSLQCYEFMEIDNQPRVNLLTIKSPLIDNNENVVGVFGISYYLTGLFPEKISMFTHLGGNELQLKKSYKQKIANLFLHKKVAGMNLTLRQTECLYHLVRGLSAKQIAKQLAISNRTVEYYLELIKNKLGCFSRSDLISKAIELGFGNV